MAVLLGYAVAESCCFSMLVFASTILSFDARFPILNLCSLSLWCCLLSAYCMGRGDNSVVCCCSRNLYQEHIKNKAPDIVSYQEQVNSVKAEIAALSPTASKSELVL